MKILSLLFTLLLTRVRGLKLLLLEVPSAVDMRSEVTLRCEYDLEGGNLYSVKWYKDGAEFFRYMPDYVPESRAVKSSGIAVDLKNSDMNRVTLRSLRFDNSGHYKCEVSTEAPKFDTVAQGSNMTVVGYPSEDPRIEGVVSTYHVGDYVSANCTSGKSRPPASITWQVNGVKADSWTWEYRSSEDLDALGMRTKTSGLHFQVLSSHSGKSKLEIQCSASVATSVRRTSVVSSVARTMTSHKLHQELPSNGSGRVVSALVLLLVTSWCLVTS